MKTNDHAFTRIELLFCAAAVALVLIPALSVLASDKSESQRIVCFNNLRQIGRAFQLWASDHGNANPWVVEPPAGGTRYDPLGGNLWYQYLMVSNQLGSPKLLVCPSDTATKKVADNWSNLPPGGFLTVPYRNRAVSYIISLHSLPFAGQALLCADRNLRPSGSSTCSFLPGGIGVPQLILGDPQVQWTNSIHGEAGHLLFGDGSVRFVNSSELRSVIDPARTDGGWLHYLSP
jgi:hypothetical protein